MLALAALNVGYLGYQLTAWAEIGARSADEGTVGLEPDAKAGLVLLREVRGETLRRRRTISPPGTSAATVAVSPQTLNRATSARATQPVAPERPDMEEAGATCFTVGPLDETAPLLPMQQWFESRGVAAHVTERERRDVSLHWVFLPPFANHDEAVATALEMRAKGIADIHVLRKGDMAHAISLGAFSREDTTQRRIRELQAEGYSPSTTRRYYGTVAGWMDVASAEGLRAIEFRKAFRAVNITERPCEPEELETL